MMVILKIAMGLVLGAGICLALVWCLATIAVRDAFYRK